MGGSIEPAPPKQENEATLRCARQTTPLNPGVLKGLLALPSQQGRPPPSDSKAGWAAAGKRRSKTSKTLLAAGYKKKGTPRTNGIDMASWFEQLVPENRVAFLHIRETVPALF